MSNPHIEGALTYLHAPCGCRIDCPSKAYLLFGASDAHMAQHREMEAGIIHPYDENIKKILLPKLIYRPPKEMVDKVVKQYNE